MTYAAYLAAMGYKTVLLISGDLDKLAQQKQKLVKTMKNDKEFTVLTYCFDFTKRQTQEKVDKLEEYVTRVAAKFENHCSVLVNNIATTRSRFNQLDMNQIGEETNIRIDNFSSITNLLMVKIRQQSIRKYRALVVNVGTTKDCLVEKDHSFETAKEQADWEIFRATTIYWSNLAALKERKEAIEVDFVKDSPENQGFFTANLKYLGLEVTPGSHVDQVFRSVVSLYQNRQA